MHSLSAAQKKRIKRGAQTQTHILHINKSNHVTFLNVYKVYIYYIYRSTYIACPLTWYVCRRMFEALHCCLIRKPDGAVPLVGQLTSLHWPCFLTQSYSTTSYTSHSSPRRSFTWPVRILCFGGLWLNVRDTNC